MKLRHSLEKRSSFCCGANLPLGFPGGSAVKNLPANAGDVGLTPGLGRFPWRSKWQPTPVFLPVESHGQRSLVGYRPQDLKKSDMTERLMFSYQVLARMWKKQNSQTLLMKNDLPVSLKVRYMPTISSNQSTPRYIPRDMKTCVHTQTYSWVFIFVVAKNWK